MATGANYGAIADCHGVSRSSVTRAVKKVSNYFHDHLQQYVIWPNSTTEKNNNAVTFFHYKKKPGCFGLVDGTHVPIQCPRGVTTDENQYYCYKGYYSINAMVSKLHYIPTFHLASVKVNVCKYFLYLVGYTYFMSLFMY